jgi:hypothetical protein
MSTWRVRSDWGWTIPFAFVAVVLTATAVGRLSVGFLAIGQSPQFDYEEPIIYSQAARFLDSAPLYQPLDRPPYSVAAYTPLYFKVVSELQGHLSPGFAPGRAVSYLAGLATALAVAWLAARYARSVWAGALAAVTFVGLGFGGAVPWFGLYRVDMLAEVLAIGAVVVLTRGTRTSHVLLAALLAAGAILSKQTYFASALAGGIWLWSIGERRKAALFAALAFGVALAVCVAEEVATGAFYANAVFANAANPISLPQFGSLVDQFRQVLFIPVAIACVYVVGERAWKPPGTRLLTVYWIASALQLSGLAKYGAVHNYWIEFAAPTAVLAALGIWTVGRRARRRAASRVLLWVFAANLALIAPVLLVADAQRLLGVTTLNGDPPETDAQFQQLIDLVEGQPGGVLADPLDVVVLAHRPVLLEPVAFAMLDTRNLWDPTPLVRSICSGQVSLVIVRIPLEPLSQFTWNGMPWWPPEVMRALVQRMRLDGQVGSRLLYVVDGAGVKPPPAGQPSAC